MNKLLKEIKTIDFDLQNRQKTNKTLEIKKNLFFHFVLTTKIIQDKLKKTSSVQHFFCYKASNFSADFSEI